MEVALFLLTLPPMTQGQHIKLLSSFSVLYEPSINLVHKCDHSSYSTMRFSSCMSKPFLVSLAIHGFTHEVLVYINNVMTILLFYLEG